MPINRTSDTPSPVDDREHGANQALIVPWDLSDKPKNNSNRAKGKKLGKFQIQDHAVAILEVDSLSLASTLIDGYQRGGEKLTSYAVLEPDNWIARLHTVTGTEGIDNTWDIRMTVDHCEKSDTRTQRSMMLIDQFRDQHWGWLMDAFWVTERRADLTDEEIFLDSAGFLSQFTKNPPINKRGAVAFNICRDAGFISDTTYYAQLFHNFCFLDVPSPGTRELCLPPNFPDELGIRGDAWFKWERAGSAGFVKAAFQPVTPELPNVDSYSSDIHEAFMFVDEDKKRPLLPGLDTLDDPQSNMPPIPKIERSLVRWFVKLPDPSSTSYYDSSYHGVPPASVYYYYAAGLGQPLPSPDADNPDGVPGGGGTDRPDVESVDNKPPIFASRQVQHGFSRPTSPGYSQRFNVFPKHADANPTNSFIYQKPEGATQINFEIMAKPSAVIPIGETAELDIFIGEFKDDKGPVGFSAAKMVFDDTTPAGEDAVWTRFERLFVGFQAAEEQILIILGRRNDITPIPAIEIWQLSLEMRARK